MHVGIVLIPIRFYSSAANTEGPSKLAGCGYFRLLGRSTPDNISDKLMSKADAIFTKVARFGVRLHCSIQPYPTR